MMDREAGHDAVELPIRERQVFRIATFEIDIGQSGLVATRPRLFEHLLGGVEGDHRGCDGRKRGGDDARTAGDIEQAAARRRAERRLEA